MELDDKFSSLPQRLRLQSSDMFLQEKDPFNFQGSSISSAGSFRCESLFSQHTDQLSNSNKSSGDTCESSKHKIQLTMMQTLPQNLRHLTLFSNPDAPLVPESEGEGFNFLQNQLSSP